MLPTEQRVTGTTRRDSRWVVARRNRGRSAKQRIGDAERRAEALRLKKAGLTLDEIAAQMGYKNRSGPAGVIKRALEEMWQEPARALVDQEIAKCDEHERTCQALIAANLEASLLGDEERHRIVDRAMARAQACRHDRAKYLGLFAKAPENAPPAPNANPPRIEITVLHTPGAP